MRTRQGGLAADLMELARAGGEAPRWGGELTLPFIATDPDNLFQGEPRGILASISLPAPIPLHFRWGAFTAGLPAVQGHTQFLSVASATGVRHHDYVRVALEWGIPNAVKCREWVGPNHAFRFTAQQVTARVHRMSRLPDAVTVRGMLGVGDGGVPSPYEKAVISHRTTVAAVSNVWVKLVGTNYARRGGYVRADALTSPGNPPEIAFESATPANNTGRLLDNTFGVWDIAIPDQWCGPVWARTFNAVPAFPISVVQFLADPPELVGWPSNV